MVLTLLNRWAVITDLKFDKQNLNSTLFPGVTSDVLVHIGFAEEHEQTAATILDDVNVLLSSSNASTVITVSGLIDLTRSLSLMASRRSATR